jgi:hypothetical protein
MMSKYSEKEFDDIVNADIRGTIGDDLFAELRSDEFVLEWKFALRRILGSLKSTRAQKLLAIERGEDGAREDYYSWATKTEWFQAAVENRFEEASIAVWGLYSTLEERLVDVEDVVFGGESV